MRPDPTFSPSPGMAMQAPAERLAYISLCSTMRWRDVEPDARVGTGRHRGA